MNETPDVTQYRHALLVAAARGSDSPEGFYAFYELIHGHPPPRHIQTMVRAIYTAKSEDKGALIFAFRGSWKTTSITVTFTAFRIGHEPHRANLIVCVNDDTANMVTGSIADIIEHNPMWKDVFPHVVPDRPAGWGANGYEVVLTHDYVEDEEGATFTALDYDEWRGRNAKRKDPTLLGMGYKSGSLIGKHPDGVLAVDDIHNEENTDSEREMNHVLKVVQDTLFPTIVEDPERPPGQQMLTWNIWVGTPWRLEDAYHFVKGTGEFYFVNVPAMSPVVAGEFPGKDDVVEQFLPQELRPDQMDLQGTWVMNWPERFDKSTAVRWFNKVAKRGFWRMFLLDLTSASEFGVRYYSFPHEKIDRSWPTVGGVDYASILEEAQRSSRNRSYFALLYGAKLPHGGLVIVDGVVDRVMQDEAERLMVAAQNLFPGYQYTVFEADGKGEEALVVFRRNPRLRIYPLKTKGVGKLIRIERMLPWVSNGTIRISDENTPALNMLRTSLDNYPNSNLDVLDALYWVTQGAADALVVQDLMNAELPYPGDSQRRRRWDDADYKGFGKAPNPYVSLGRR